MNPAKAALTKSLRREAGRWLKAAREAAGLTQAELAEKTGLRYYTFVSQVENGLGRVPIEAQAVWAQSLGLEWLYRLFLQPERYRRMLKAVAVFPVMFLSIEGSLLVVRNLKRL